MLLGAAHNDEVPEGYTLSGPSPMCSGLSVFVSCEGMHMFQNDRLGPILYARTLVNFLRVRRFSVPFPHNQVRLGHSDISISGSRLYVVQSRRSLKPLHRFFSYRSTEWSE